MRAATYVVVTGNGDFTPGKSDWGESVLKLPPTLTGVTTSFTAFNYKQLNNSDGDFGSGGVMLLPAVKGQTAPPLAVAMGKSSILYLLNQNSLGGLKKNDAGALQAQSGGGSGLWGGPAFYNGPSGPTVLTQTGGDVLRAWGACRRQYSFASPITSAVLPMPATWRFVADRLLQGSGSQYRGGLVDQSRE